MKIALLGATGFVGRNVSEMLVNEGIEFLPVSKKTGYELMELSENVRFINESKCTHIVNCAANVGSLNYVTEKAGTVINTNSKMLLAMYEAVQKIDTSIIIIQPVANCAYPANAVVYKENKFWDGPVHPSVLSFGTTRRLMVSLASCYNMQYGIKSINLLTPNMYGLHDSADPNKAHALNALISKFVKAIYTNQQKVEIWGSGIAVREWVFATDFANVIKRILSDNHTLTKLENPVNIAQENGLSIRELIEKILLYVPYKGEVFYNTSMPDGAPRKVMSKVLFDQIFPNFKFTDFATGIKATIEYYQSIYPY